MTRSCLAISCAVISLSLVCGAASAEAPPDQWPRAPSVSGGEPPAMVSVEALHREDVRLQKRYRRFRIAGSVLLAVYLPAALVIAVPVSRGGTCESEDFCLFDLDLTYGKSFAIMTAALAPVATLGIISLAKGIKRGRQVALGVPQVALDRHGARFTLSASF